MNADHPPIVWVFAGLDPSGGAGVLLDSQVVAARGGWPMAIVTTSTVQSSAGLRRCEDVDGALIEAQANALLDDGLPSAVKLGALGGPTVVRAVSRSLERLEQLGFTGDVVWDPVIRPTHGDASLTEAPMQALSALRRFASVITPNRAELASLGGATDPRCLLTDRTRAIVLTGGDEPSATDTLVTRSGTRVFRGTKAAFTAHGTGCALSSCLATELAHEKQLPHALHSAKQFTSNALHDSWRTESGHRVLKVR